MTEPADEPVNSPVETATGDALSGGPDAAFPPPAKPARSRRSPTRRAAVDVGTGDEAGPAASIAADSRHGAAGAATSGDGTGEVTSGSDATTAAGVASAPARPPRRSRSAPKSEPAAASVDAAPIEPVSQLVSQPMGGAELPASAAVGVPPAADVASAPATAGAPAAAAATGANGAAGEPNVPLGARPPQTIALFAEVISGAFDADADAAPETAAPAEAPAAVAEAAPKRILQPEPEAPKLHKVLAQAGVGSRRDMEQLIADGHITVNGQPAHTGQRISFGDRIVVDGKPIKVRIQPLPARLIAYHKPAGEIVTHDDPQQRPTVFRRLPRLPQGKWQSVGRLDVNTEGLLLFTNNGQLANQLMHPRFGVEREYAVRLLGRVDDAASARLIAGIELDGQTCGFRSIEDGGGDGANHWYRVVITEGRNREVRRLFDAVGLTVSRLIRIRYGSVVLPRGLKRGVWVDLTDGDLRSVRQLLAQAPRNSADGAAGSAAERPEGDNRPPRPPKEPRPPRTDDRGNRDARGPRPPPSHAQPPRNQRPNGPRPANGPSNAAPYSAPMGADPRGRADRFEREVDPDYEEEIDHARIPNPLEQTFDKRFVQTPRGPAGGRGFGQGGGGFGHGGSAPRNGGAPRGPGKPAAGGPKEPDPMQTSVGYIGGDAFLRKANRGGSGGGGGGNGPRGGNRGGQGGGGGGGGGGGYGGGGGFRGR